MFTKPKPNKSIYREKQKVSESHNTPEPNKTYILNFAIL